MQSDLYFVSLLHSHSLCRHATLLRTGGEEHCVTTQRTAVEQTTVLKSPLRQGQERSLSKGWQHTVTMATRPPINKTLPEMQYD